MSRISDKAKRGLEWLGFRVTGSRWAWTVAIGAVALWAGTQGPIPKGNPLPSPSPASPQAPLQYTTDSRIPWAVSTLVVGKLPPPIKDQYKAPCSTDVEREIAGYCWIPIDVKPCPEGKAWTHEGDGKCYLRAMRFPKKPNAGDPDVPYGIARPIE